MATEEEKEEAFFSCRYGEVDEVQSFVKKYGAAELASTRDDQQNTVLHMICGNGHEEILDYLLPSVDPALISSQNSSGSTPLHWAAINSHLSICKKLVEFPGGPGVELIDVKNLAGHTALGEAELSGWDEGAKWFVEVMKLDDAPKSVEADEVIDPSQSIEVEIEDAEGHVAKMNISQKDLEGARQSS